MFSLMMLQLLMAVQVRGDIDTRPFILAGVPVALRKDDQTIQQDAGRSAVLASKTLMALIAFSLATTGTADAGNTGDGTCTAVAKLSDGGNLLTGDYNLECTGAVANGGIFKLEDPKGNLIEGNLTMTAGAGAATIFNIGGITFTLTDGATDFASGDIFTLTVTAINKWVPYNPVGVQGEAIPKGIYDPESTIGDITAAALVAGDVVDMPILIADARFDKDALVFENSGAYTDIIPGTSLNLEEYLRTMNLIAEYTISGSAAENV